MGKPQTCLIFLKQETIFKLRNKDNLRSLKDYVKSVCSNSKKKSTFLFTCVVS